MFKCPHTFVHLVYVYASFWLCHEDSQDIVPFELNVIKYTFFMSYSLLFLSVFQKTRTTMHTCPTPKWTLTSGVRRPGRRNVLPWRSSLMSWRNITATNSLSQIEILFQQEVSTVCVIHACTHMYVLECEGIYSCSYTVAAAVFGTFVTLCHSLARATPQQCEFKGLNERKKYWMLRMDECKWGWGYTWRRKLYFWSEMPSLAAVEASPM